MTNILAFITKLFSYIPEILLYIYSFFVFIFRGIKLTFGRIVGLWETITENYTHNGLITTALFIALIVLIYRIDDALYRKVSCKHALTWTSIELNGFFGRENRKNEKRVKKNSRNNRKNSMYETDPVKLAQNRQIVAEMEAKFKKEHEAYLAWKRTQS